MTLSLLCIGESSFSGLLWGFNLRDIIWKSLGETENHEPMQLWGEFLFFMKLTKESVLGSERILRFFKQTKKKMASGRSKTTGYRVGRKNRLFFETRKSIWHLCPTDTRKGSRDHKLFYLIFSLLVSFVVSSQLLYTFPCFTTIESLLQICKNKQAISRLPASDTTSCVGADDK